MTSPLAVTPVDSVGGIEHELAKLAVTGVGDGAPVVRARTLNLVVRGDSAQQRDHAVSVLAQLGESHPSRAIIVASMDTSAAPRIEARVEVRHRGVGGRLLCYEQVAIDTYGVSGRHVTTVIEPLLISHLPICLWWVGDPDFSHEVFEELAGLCDRIIVDSQCFTHVGANLAELHACIERADLLVTDLNWVRMLSWREVVAQLFSGAGEQACLGEIARVTIGTTGPDMIQPLLLFGWMASRLSWTIHSDGVRRAGSAGEGAGSIDLRIKTGDANECEIKHLVIESGADDHRARFEVARQGSQLIAKIEGSRISGLSRLTRIRRLSEPELLQRGLASHPRDGIFDAAVEAARALLPVVSA